MFYLCLRRSGPSSAIKLAIKIKGDNICTGKTSLEKPGGWFLSFSTPTSTRKDRCLFRRTTLGSATVVPSSHCDTARNSPESDACSAGHPLLMTCPNYINNTDQCLSFTAQVDRRTPSNPPATGNSLVQEERGIINNTFVKNDILGSIRIPYMQPDTEFKKSGTFEKDMFQL